MKPEILSRLAAVNDEERRIIEGEQKINKNLFSAYTKEFIINRHRMMQDGEQIALRRHTRFTDFPPHGHNYVEMTYVCSGEVVHVIKHREVRMHKGDVLLLNRHTQHSVRKTGEDDIAINILLATGGGTGSFQVCTGGLTSTGGGSGLLFSTVGTCVGTAGAGSADGAGTSANSGPLL